MARLYMDRGRDEDAASALRDIIDSDASSQVQAIGRLRLARVLLYQGKAQEVVDIFNAPPAEAFVARYNEVLGDAYVDLERYDDAADAYAIALSDNPQVPTVDVTLVQMKLNDLPEEGAQPAVDETLSTETPDEGDEVTAEGDGESIEEPGADQ
jgi:predicted negative regulator of RcsB-dependent stress response